MAQLGTAHTTNTFPASQAQDEFGCFNRPKPECAQEDFTNITAITCSVMLVTLWYYHHYITRNNRLVGCKVEKGRE